MIAMRRLTITVIALFTLVVGGAIGQGQRVRMGDTSLRVGDKAPDFTIKELNSGKPFTLSSNLGKRPTVLIFGSYT